MSKKGDEAAAYYADPAHRDSDGPGYALPDRPARLSSHVPIRFDRDAIAAIKQFADEDGLTVSAWVRHVVGREIKRRVTLRTLTGSRRNSGVMLSISQSEGPTTTSTSATMFVTELRAVG